MITFVIQVVLVQPCGQKNKHEHTEKDSGLPRKINYGKK